MNADDKMALVGIMVLLAALFALLVQIVAFENGCNTGYRQGQIDALTGKITVELVEHPDGTKTWESKKGGGE